MFLPFFDDKKIHTAISINVVLKKIKKLTSQDRKVTWVVSNLSSLLRFKFETDNFSSKENGS